MGKFCHIFLGITFIIVVSNIAIIDSALTYKQMETAGKMMRETCQPPLELTDEIIDGLKAGKFPDNDNLKCYVNCIMELMVLLREGVPNFDFAIKQMNRLLPEELREPYLNALNACRTAADGITNKCQVAYSFLQCFHNNNPLFMFP